MDHGGAEELEHRGVAVEDQPAVGDEFRYRPGPGHRQLEVGPVDGHRQGRVGCLEAGKVGQRPVAEFHDEGLAGVGGCQVDGERLSGDGLRAEPDAEEVKELARAQGTGHVRA